MVFLLFCAKQGLVTDILFLVTVTQISYSRVTGAETWITSDGRAYLVRLEESGGQKESVSDLGSEDIPHLQVDVHFSRFDIHPCL